MKIKVVNAYNPETEDEIYYIEMPKNVYEAWAKGGKIYLNRWTTDCNVDSKYFIDVDHWFVTKEGLETNEDTEYYEKDDSFYNEDEGMAYYSLKSLNTSYGFGILTSRDFGDTVGVMCSTFNN